MAAMDPIKTAWLKFNEYENKLKGLLGGNSSVGIYAEHLAHKYYGGTILGISHKSADIKSPKGKLYQVKSRKITKTNCTKLGIIRSWDFHYLVVILFNAEGTIRNAIEFPMDVAKEYAAENKHRNGWVITTTTSFLNDNRATDITLSLQTIKI